MAAGVEVPDLRILQALRCEPADVVPRDDYVDLADFLGWDDVAYTIRAPRGLDPGVEAVVRSLAAGINNELMLKGYTSVVVHTSSPLAEAVHEMIGAHYAQVFEQGRTLEDLRHRTSGAYQPLGDGGWPRPGVAAARGPALGLNIGQSFVKAVVTDHHGDAIRTQRLETFGGVGPSRAARLRSNILDLVGDLDPGADGCCAVGISIGGVVIDGRIRRDSGITSGMDAQEYAIVDALAGDVHARTGVPVLVGQDVQAKGYHHASTNPGRSLLVLDIGTSIGGAYVDQDARISQEYNQVGRVAIDVSLHALRHPDNRGTGLMSQYLSARGAVTYLRNLGVDIADTVGLEEQLRRLPGRVRRELAAVLASYLHVSTVMLRRHYSIDRLLLSGGLVADKDLARHVTDSLAARNGETDVAVSAEPVYDSALGVARAAAAAAR